jgi:hypothetical protein
MSCDELALVRNHIRGLKDPICFLVLILIYILGATSSLHSASIDSDSQAIATSNEAIGLQSLTRAKIATNKITAKSLSFVDTTTPFVYSLFNGRPSWQVAYGQVNIQLDSIAHAEDTCTKLVTASLDSSTGQLLEIDFYGVPDSVVGFQMPSPKRAEMQIAAGFERYYGLPSVPPKVSLAHALKMVGEYFQMAAHTRVHYLTVSKQVGNKVDTFPAWWIYMRGTQLLKVVPAPPGTYQHASILVNAITGKSFGISNRPFPPLDDGRHQ